MKQKSEFDFSSQRTVSPYLFGTNLEHTRSCVHMGISAQMLQNRKFAGKPERNGAAHEWYPIGERTYLNLANGPEEFMGIGKVYTGHGDGYHMKREHECNAQIISDFYGQEANGIGQHGLTVQQNREYEFRIAAAVYQDTVFCAALTSRNGGRIYAQGEICLKKSGEVYQTASISLQPDCDDTDADLRITFSGKGTVLLGAVSLMPQDHFHGMRRDVIALLKEAGIRLLRWPGGNFAGEYNWKDGLLPADMRAPFESYMGIETQPHSMGYDFHEINTDDFIALCREIDAEPFITINPAWNTPEESAQWVEYCNGDETTEYGRLRMERGYAEPYRVRFWSLGNEFGYGHMEGDNTAGGYCRVVSEHAERMLQVSSDLRLCSSGPYPNAEWADQAARPLKPLASLVSLHHYTRFPDFLDVTRRKEDYDACIADVETGDRALLYQLRDQLKDDSIRISFDEWNTWYAWYRPGSVCDGIFAACMFHMLIAEAEAAGMELACHFEAVNEGVIRVEPTRARLTPMGQIFALMKQHAGGTLCCAERDVIATEKDGRATVTLVNRSYDETRCFTLPIIGEVETIRWYGADEVVPWSDFTIREMEMQDTGKTDSDCGKAEQEKETKKLQEEAFVQRISDELQISLPEHSVMLVQMKKSVN